jgi:hypothetical protein
VLLSYTRGKRRLTPSLISLSRVHGIETQERAMNPDSPSRSAGGETPAARQETDRRAGKTPNTDMQPEDAGTADSGNDDSGTAATRAMKQTSKTPSESGNTR